MTATAVEALEVVLCFPVTVAEAEIEPIGWYSPREVGRLAGVSGRQVGQWARHGYMQSARAAASPRAYSFQDVAEAMVLHYLHEQGVPYRSIRKAVRRASDLYGHRWPLSSARLFIVADHPQGHGPRRTVVVDDFDVVAGHPVLGQLDLLEVKRDLEFGGWAARENRELRHIEVNPGRRSGTPVIRGTRIAAEDVAVLAARPGGRRELVELYELSPAEIDDAVAWFEIVSNFDR